MKHCFELQILGRPAQMAITLEESPKDTCYLGLFILHWGLRYTQNPNTKAIRQLTMFPREKSFKYRKMILE